jgi:AraC family transcriptional regulator
MGDREMTYDAIIEESLEFIEANLSEPLNLEIVSAHSHLSKYYYHRLFSAVLGCSLNQYVLSRKLNRAIQWIQETDFSLTEIAYQLDFGNQASFIRAFKNQFGFPPNDLRKRGKHLDVESMPQIVKRPFKNLKGDILTDFTLLPFETKTITGIAFEVDLSKPDYKADIRGFAQMLNAEIAGSDLRQRYMIYSNCQPGTSQFKALYGVEGTFKSSLQNVFTVEVEEIFCARFKYQGDLLEISDIFVSDFMRFIKVTKLDSQDNHIELIQMFDVDDEAMTDYEIWVPIEKTKEDAL